MPRQAWKKTRDDVIRVQELRQSNAAAPHNKKTDRQQWRKKKLNRNYSEDE